MKKVINQYQKGLTLIETLLSLSIVIAIVISFLYWYLEQKREQQATIFGKEVVSIISAFDNRVHIDGLDIDNFKNGHEWNGSSAFLNMMNTEFIAKQSSCGQPNNWVPVLEKEKSIKLVPCDFWTKVPYQFIINSKIIPDDDGFIKKFIVSFQSKNEASFLENFRFYNLAKMTANANNSLNITGSHQFYFAAITDPSINISNSKCLSLKADCILVAAYDRNGGNEYLRVDGTNSIIGSAVTFKDTKTTDRLQCIKWEKNVSGNLWESKSVDCGIGIHKETNSPVAVDIAISSSTHERIMLDRLCPVFKNTPDSLIETIQKTPCGLFPQDDNGIEVAYQVIDTVSAGKGLIKTLYTSTVFSDEVNTNYMNVKKDLAVLGNSVMDGTLTVKGTGQFDNNINLTKVEIAGKACATDGLLSRDVKGSILTCTSKLWRSAEETKIQSGRDYTMTCGSYWMNAAQKICGSMTYVDIVFKEEMPTIPHIIASAESLFPYTPCAAGAMDAIDHVISNVTTKGFRLYGGASPMTASSDACGIYAVNGRAVSLFSWLAVAKTAPF